MTPHVSFNLKKTMYKKFVWHINREEVGNILKKTTSRINESYRLRDLYIFSFVYGSPLFNLFGLQKFVLSNVLMYSTLV